VLLALTLASCQSSLAPTPAKPAPATPETSAEKGGTVEATEPPAAAPACASFSDPAVLKSIAGPAKELQADNPVFAPPAVAGRRERTEPPLAPAVPPYFVGRPAAAKAGQPIPVLLAVHGVASSGSDFAAPLVPLSQSNGWLLIAPTLQYHNYNSPLETRADDLLLISQLDALLEDVPRRTGLLIEPKVLALGFSRGAGLLERYVMARPERIAAVASMSSGAYTLPQACAEAAGRSEPLPFPLGTADFERWAGRRLDAGALRRIPLWVAVGAKDVIEPPAPWDGLLGRTRVERAEAYVGLLRQFGKTAQSRLYPGLKHEVTRPELQDALSFLQSPDTAALSHG